MQMWTPDFLSVWITMWGASEIKANQDNYLVGAKLIGPFCEIYPSTADVQKEFLVEIIGN